MHIAKNIMKKWFKNITTCTYHDQSLALLNSYQVGKWQKKLKICRHKNEYIAFVSYVLSNMKRYTNINPNLSQI